MSISSPGGFSTAVNTAGTPSQGIFYFVAAGGETGITCNSTANTRLGLHIYEYSGLDSNQSTVLDAVATTNSGTGTTASTNAVTTTNANDLLIAGVVANANTACSGWTNSFVEQNDFTNGAKPSNRSTYCGADRIVSATGSYSTAATIDSSDWRADVAAFKEAAAAPTVSCSTNIASTDFGALSASSIATSSPNASTTMSCSGTTAGCVLYVKDAGNGSDPGLSTSTPAYLIPSPDAAFSATTTLSINVEGYGIQATTTAAGLTIDARYNWATSTDIVGGLVLSNQTFASSTADISGAEVIVTHKAAISDTTQAGAYEDTITYECVVN